MACFIKLMSPTYDSYTNYRWTHGETNWPQALFNSFIFIFLGLIIAMSGRAILRLLRSKSYGLGLIVFAGLVVVAALGLISWFDECILPGLPQSLAGARIEKVLLLANQSHRSAFVELSIPMTPGGKCPNLSDTVGLVYETEHALLIQRGDLPPIILDRSLVDAIVGGGQFECARTMIEPANSQPYGGSLTPASNP